jgi:hypothetical protein
MQTLPAALRRLEHLKQLVEEYGPIRFQSTERTHELARQIPEAYGAVEDVYRHYAGDHEVIVEDRKRYFEISSRPGGYPPERFIRAKVTESSRRSLGVFERRWKTKQKLQLTATLSRVHGRFSIRKSR